MTLTRADDSPTLEHERKDIAGNEDSRVPGGWTKSRPRFAEAQYNVLKSKVYASGDESRRNDQAADLDLETNVVVGVVVQHDAADVANELTQTTESKANLGWNQTSSKSTQEEDERTMNVHVLYRTPSTSWMRRQRPKKPAKKPLAPMLG